MLRIVLERERLSVISGRTTLEADTWTVPRDQWTHVGIQVSGYRVLWLLFFTETIPPDITFTLSLKNVLCLSEKITLRIRYAFLKKYAFLVYISIAGRQLTLESFRLGAYFPGKFTYSVGKARGDPMI